MVTKMDILMLVKKSLSTVLTLCFRARMRIGLLGPFPSCVPWIQFAPSSTVTRRPGAPNEVLCIRPPSSFRASTMRKSVIPSSVSLRAVMIPATPPPRMSACFLSFGGRGLAPAPSSERGNGALQALALAARTCAQRRRLYKALRSLG